jgi:hypothetical protein
MIAGIKPETGYFDESVPPAGIDGDVFAFARLTELAESF